MIVATMNAITIIFTTSANTSANMDLSKSHIKFILQWLKIAIAHLMN